MERRGASIEDRTGESCSFQTILIVVLLEYYCCEIVHSIVLLYCTPGKY